MNERERRIGKNATNLQECLRYTTCIDVVEAAILVVLAQQKELAAGNRLGFVSGSLFSTLMFSTAVLPIQFIFGLDVMYIAVIYFSDEDPQASCV